MNPPISDTSAWIAFGPRSASSAGGAPGPPRWPGILAAFVVALLTRRPAVLAFWAAVVVVSCELGYAIATENRGGSNATSTVVCWLTAAVIAGPPLGVGAAWTRQGDWWFGASTGPAVLAREPIYALSTIADTTMPA